MDIRSVLLDHGIKQGFSSSEYSDDNYEVLNNRINTLDLFVNNSFRDGVIEEVEALKIQAYINTINDINIKLNERFELLVTNVDLTDVEVKADLISAKVTYDGSYESLIGDINNAIKDMKTTPEESSRVNASFLVLTEASAYLERLMQLAADSILNARTKQVEDNAKDYADSINLTNGSKNRALNTNFKNDFMNWTFVPSVNASDVLLERDLPNYMLEDSTHTYYLHAPDVEKDVTASVRSDKIPVEAGQRYTLSYYMSLIRIRMKHEAVWLDKDGNVISKIIDSLTEQTGVDEGFTALGHLGMRRFIFKSTAPANATHAVIIFSLQHSFGNGYLFFDDFMLEKGDEATDYYPSSLDILPEVRDAVEAANEANKNVSDVKDTVDSSKDGWDNAKDTVDDWTKPAEDGTSQIDGSKVAPKTIEEQHIKSLSWAIARGGQLALGGPDNGNGELVVYGEDEDDIRVELNTLDDEGEYASSFQKFSAKSLYVSDNIEAPNIIKTTLAGMVIAVDPINGDDENSGNGWGNPLRTIQEAVNRVPKYLMHDVEISIHYDNGRNIYEEVYVEGFTGSGKLLIDFQNNSNTLYGYFHYSANTAAMNINKGRVIALTAGHDPIYCINNKNMRFDYVIVDGNKKTTYGFSISNTRADIRYCESYNALDSAIISSYGSMVDVIDCKGSSKYGLKAYRASILAGAGTAPLGTSANQIEIDGGIVQGSFSYPVVTVPTTPTPITYKTVTLTSTSQKSWRPNYGGQWYKNEVTQGKYSSFGRYKGFWFFGSQFDQFNGKTITSVRLYAKRYSGGGSGYGQNARFVLHNYASQPSSTVSPAIFGGDSTTYAVTSSFEWGQAKWVDATKMFKGYINRSDVKGIGLWVYADSPYMLFSGALKVEVKYQV